MLAGTRLLCPVPPFHLLDKKALGKHQENLFQQGRERGHRFFRYQQQEPLVRDNAVLTHP